ncbi:MAG: HAMP domain-containing histidine kinase [Oscillospiraceae bacterium]|nr:HAMP domain-containing histidine kinase [Oscillospiraceae bacterium]
MREPKSLFRKYFSIYAVTMLICIFMLGVVLLFFATQYFRDDNRRQLMNVASKGIEVTVSNYDRNKGFLTRNELEKEFELIHRTTGVSVLFCDIDGRIEVCSEGGMCSHLSLSIPSVIRETILNQGEFFSVGYMEVFTTESSYTYGCPVVMDGTIRGYLFISKSLEELFDFLYQIIMMFLFSSASAFGLSFIIVFYATRMLTKPLNEISEAARKFGAGDFSVRVKVPVAGDEIGMLAEVFNNMAYSVSELENVRRNFVEAASHELRTPMTTIAGYIDAILDGTIPQKEQSHYLYIISEEVKRLARLTSSLLIVARLEAEQQEMNITNHNAWDTVLDIMWNMEQRIAEKRIEIKELDVDARFIQCDQDMLHQVIYNLLDNAVKYTNEGGMISVEMFKKADTTEIVIGNTGSGIPKDQLEKVFDRFYKLDSSRSLDTGGSGLGLYITKTLVEKMDGSITVQSEPDGLTKFTVIFKNGTSQSYQTQERTVEELNQQKVSLMRRISRGIRKGSRR